MKEHGFARMQMYPELDLSGFVGNKSHFPRSIDNPLFRPVAVEEGDKLTSNLGDHIDVEWSVRMMDKLWNASLYDFIKGQENSECIARYLSPLIQDYDIPQIVTGLTWLLDGWKPESKARTLRLLFADYTPRYSGAIFAKLAVDWDFDTDVTMNTALILIKEPAKIAAGFIARLSEDWEASRVVELIGCLDVILDWSEVYFQEFTLCVMEIIGKGCKEGEDVKSVVLLEQLALMYEMNLAQTNLKIAMADYQLAITEQKLKNLSVVLDQSRK